MKNWKLYLLNAILLFIVGYHILPDFSLNDKNFKRVSGIVSSVKLETYKNRRSKEILFRNIIRERLIIRIADQNFHEYYLSNTYKRYWPELLKNQTKGKNIVLYLGTGNQIEDPFKIELNGEILYNTNIRFYRSLSFIVFTLVLTIYNILLYLGPKVETTIQKVKVNRRYKFVYFKHKFLENKKDDN